MIALTAHPTHETLPLVLLLLSSPAVLGWTVYYYAGFLPNGRYRR